MESRGPCANCSAFHSGQGWDWDRRHLAHHHLPPHQRPRPRHHGHRLIRRRMMQYCRQVIQARVLVAVLVGLLQEHCNHSTRSTPYTVTRVTQYCCCCCCLRSRKLPVAAVYMCWWRRCTVWEAGHCCCSAGFFHTLALVHVLVAPLHCVGGWALLLLCRLLPHSGSGT